MGIRQERVESEIAKALGDILPTLKDPRVTGLISVMNVAVTKDFSYADVTLSVYGTEDKESVLDAIRNSAGFIRHELRKYIGSIHTLPQLRFIYDESRDKIDKINKLLDQISNDKK